MLGDLLNLNKAQRQAARAERARSSGAAAMEGQCSPYVLDTAVLDTGTGGSGGRGDCNGVDRGGGGKGGGGMGGGGGGFGAFGSTPEVVRNESDVTPRTWASGLFNSPEEREGCSPPTATATTTQHQMKFTEESASASPLLERSACCVRNFTAKGAAHAFAAKQAASKGEGSAPIGVNQPRLFDKCSHQSSLSHHSASSARGRASAARATPQSQPSVPLSAARQHQLEGGGQHDARGQPDLLAASRRLGHHKAALASAARVADETAALAAAQLGAAPPSQMSKRGHELQGNNEAVTGRVASSVARQRAAAKREATAHRQKMELRRTAVREAEKLGLRESAPIFWGDHTQRDASVRESHSHREGSHSTSDSEESARWTPEPPIGAAAGASNGAAVGGDASCAHLRLDVQSARVDQCAPLVYEAEEVTEVEGVVVPLDGASSHAALCASSHAASMPGRGARWATPLTRPTTLPASPPPSEKRRHGAKHAHVAKHAHGSTWGHSSPAPPGTRWSNPPTKQQSDAAAAAAAAAAATARGGQTTRSEYYAAGVSASLSSCSSSSPPKQAGGSQQASQHISLLPYANETKDVVPRPQTIIAEASGAESNQEYNQKAVEELRRRILSRGF